MEQIIPPPRRVWTPALVELCRGVALFVLAAIVLAPASHGGFLWGDDQFLTANPQVHAPDGWWTLWLAPRTADYFPLSSTTFWLEWRLWGMAPHGYHVTNILLHAAAAVFTWRTLRCLAVPGAWVAAAIFAVHPVCVESVAWISERTNILSQIFFLLSIISFVSFMETRTRWRYAAALICFILALLAKSTVVMLPCILLLLAWWRSRHIEPRLKGRELMLWMTPFFLVSLVLGVLTIDFQFGRAIGDEIIPIGNLLQRAISAGFAAGFYLYSALWPFNLSPVYPEWQRAFSTLERFPSPHLSPPSPDAIPYWKQAIPGVLIAGLLLYCWLRRTEPWARALYTGLGCYFIALLPVLGFITMSYMRITLVADHFQYISIVAVIALVVAGGYQRALKPAWLIAASAVFGLLAYFHWSETRAFRLPETVWVVGPLALALVPSADEIGWKWVWNGFLTLVLLSFAVTTRNLSGNYQSEETYMTAVLAKNPNCWQAHNHLGAALYMRGDIKDAYPHFQKATELKPENPESHNNLGLAESYFGMKEEAIKEYQAAVRIKDDSAMDTNLANAYEELGRYPEAIAEYKHAIQLNPQNASAWCNMGYGLVRLGQLDDAIPCFMEAIEIDPAMPQSYTDLDKTLQMLGIDPNAPPQKGSFPFDLKKALELLRANPRKN